MRLALYFTLLLTYYTSVRLVLYDDPEITQLAKSRRLKPAGGVLRPLTSQRHKARLYGEKDPPVGKPCAFVIVLWGNDYVLPASVLVKSLLNFGTSHDIEILVPKSGSHLYQREALKHLKC